MTILHTEPSICFFDINVIIDFFSFKKLCILLKITVKYISELFIKWVSNPLSNDWVLSCAILSFWVFIVGLDYNRGLLVSVLDNLGYAYCCFRVGV